jgi:uncharacterized protein
MGDMPMRLPEWLRPESCLRGMVYHPGRVILLTVLITLLFASHLPSLRFETSIYDLTIEDLPETLTYHRFKETFGCEEIILVVARTTGVFDPETFDRIAQLAQSLSQIHGVKRVISLPGIKKDMDITGRWRLTDFQEVVSVVDLFQRNLISDDGKTTAITLVLEDVDQKERVIHAVNGLIDAYQNAFSLYQVGMPIVSSALAQFTQQDFLTLPIATFFLIATVLFLLFRNLRGILIPSGTVLISLIWTFGLMAWTGTPLSLLTMIVPVFLIAVGTAYAMYIFPEYFDSVDQSATPREAAVRCFSRLGFPTSLAVVTTIIGLGSLLVSQVNDIRQFAVFSCFGIFSLLILLLTFVPAVMGLLPFPKRSMVSPSFQSRAMDRILSTIIHLNLKHQKITLPLIAVIGVVGLIGMSRIQVETNPVEFFKRDTPVARHFHDIYQDMAGSFPLNVVLAGRQDGYFEDPENLKKIEEIQEFLNSLPGVDKTISLADYLKLVNYASNQYNPTFYVLPEAPFEVRMLINSFKSMLGQEMLLQFASPEFSQTNLMLRTHISSSIDFLTTEKKIRDYLHRTFSDEMSFEVTGFGMVISHSSQLISEGQVKSLGLTLVLVFAIMFMLFMSYKVGAIALLPNCFPIVVTFGVMGWFGIPLSMATSLVATIAIGLAVDDTIHYLVGYNREFKAELNKETALSKTIRHLGKPILFTTFTIGLGFSVLMLSNFKPTAVFGLLMMITMASALVADLFLLPSLMLHVELVTLWDLLKVKLGKDPQQGIPLFKGLSRTQVHYVLMAGALKVHERGDLIFRKGEVSDSMYAIISGAMEVVDLSEEDRDGAQGFKRVISTLGSGDVVGEMGMIRSCKRSATVIATERTELLQINDRMMRRLQWLYPPTAHRFFFNLMTILCDRLEHLTNTYLKETIIDRPTGLYTRGFFLTLLEREIARFRRHRTPVSLFILTLDNLPDLNARYDQGGIDHLIAEAGRLLKAHLREEDLLCRYDGNQFAGMLIHMDGDTARAFCSRMNTLINHMPFQIDGETVHIRAAFGVSSLSPESDMEMTPLIASAWEALRQAQQADPDQGEEA